MPRSEVGARACPDHFRRAIAIPAGKKTLFLELRGRPVYCGFSGRSAHEHAVRLVARSEEAADRFEPAARKFFVLVVDDRARSEHGPEEGTFAVRASPVRRRDHLFGTQRLDSTEMRLQLIARLNG